MNQASKNFLKALISTPSPSGAEEAAARKWYEYAKTFADRVDRDVHGNVMAVLNPGGSPRVMLAGHIDEIGFMISHVTDDGFLCFVPIGGHDIQVVQGMRVNVMTARGRIRGVLGKKPIHLVKFDDRKKVPEFEELTIDIGAKDAKEARKMVAIGDAAVIDYGYEDFPNDFAVARAFDDKAGAFVVVETLRLLAGKRVKAAVYAVATVQEEIGLRGARTSAFGIDPAVGVAVDVTHATDYPATAGRERAMIGDIRLGRGPAVSRGPNINPKVFKRLIAAAKAAKIPVQVEPEPGGTPTDANVIQLSRAGVAAGLVSVPTRYIHTPCEMVSLKDIENTCKLLVEFVAGLTPGANFVPSE